MYKSSNIVAAISGIVISVGTLSTTASASPKPFFIEGQILASKKTEKLKDKAKGFADKAMEYAEEAKAKAKEAEDCCRTTDGARQARQYANQAQTIAKSAVEKAEKAANTNKTSKAKDLKNKAKELASKAEKAAEKAERELNYALEQQEQINANLIRNYLARGKKVVDGSKYFIEKGRNEIQLVKDCCSNQEINGSVFWIKDAEEYLEKMEKAASEVLSAFEIAQTKKSYRQVEKFVRKAEYENSDVYPLYRKLIGSAKQAKKYPDDFSDLKGNCAYDEYQEKGKIGYEIYGKRDRGRKKVRYKGLDYEKFMKKYC